MSRQSFIDIGRALFLLLIQIWVMDRMHLGFYFHPYIFHLFILLLPVVIPSWQLQLIAFSSGLMLDMMSNTAGLQAASILFMAFLRPQVLSILTPKSGYESIQRPGLRELGWLWVILYFLMMNFIHHSTFFMIEIFSFREWGTTFLRIMGSTLLSSTLMLLIVYTFMGGRKYNQ